MTQLSELNVIHYLEKNGMSTEKKIETAIEATEVSEIPSLHDFEKRQDEIQPATIPIAGDENNVYIATAHSFSQIQALSFVRETIPAPSGSAMVQLTKFTITVFAAVSCHD